jgi:putative hydrolase of the HAD superfamily
MKDIAHLFFDLDHTLWDFDKNSSETLSELFIEMNLGQEIASLTQFLETYKSVNAKYWQLYNHGKVNKEQVRNERFRETLFKFNVSNYLIKAKEMGEMYISRSPLKQNVFPNTHETLNYLSQKYKLHIITNGFKEVQYTKLTNSGLIDYFDLILCSEEVGVNKPNPLVFETALKKTNAIPHQSVMIGDNLEADINGAKKCGLFAIHFDPAHENNRDKTFEIKDLIELQTIL